VKEYIEKIKLMRLKQFLIVLWNKFETRVEKTNKSAGESEFEKGAKQLRKLQQ
jgi:hypothetical protein